MVRTGAGRRRSGGYGTPMQYGVTMFMTDRTIGPAALARAVEERGLHSLYIPEHTHIPVSRRTPPPTGDAELKDEYKRTLDPIVALAVAAGFRASGGVRGEGPRVGGAWAPAVFLLASVGMVVASLLDAPRSNTDFAQVGKTHGDDIRRECQNPFAITHVDRTVWRVNDEGYLQAESAGDGAIVDVVGEERPTQ